MYVTCEEHLEEAIDRFVEVYEAPPDLYLLENMSFTEWDQPATCDFCTKRPKYLVV